MKSDLWRFEKSAYKKGYFKIAGVDEAGRGPLAGPVVSAAVILPETLSISGITDSKKLSAKKRDSLFDQILDQALAVGIAQVGPAEIDRINILEAARLSMARAVENLSRAPDYLLIDGIFPIAYDLPQKTIKKGDALSISIAAASIVAKVTRDRLMRQFHRKYPEYGFSQHKGYPTKAHKAAIRRHGCCPIHRKSFKGVKEHL